MSPLIFSSSCIAGSCEDEVDSFIKNLSLKFCLNALAIMAVGYLHMMCWCTTAERQIKVSENPGTSTLRVPTYQQRSSEQNLHVSNT